jgi:hypothetical protein
MQGTEINCIEFIEFIDDSNVNVLIGGGDIFSNTNTALNDHKIELSKLLD